MRKSDIDALPAKLHRAVGNIEAMKRMQRLVRSHAEVAVTEADAAEQLRSLRDEGIEEPVSEADDALPRLGSYPASSDLSTGVAFGGAPRRSRSAGVRDQVELLAKLSRENARLAAVNEKF